MAVKHKRTIIITTHYIEEAKQANCVSSLMVFQTIWKYIENKKLSCEKMNVKIRLKINGGKISCYNTINFTDLLKLYENFNKLNLVKYLQYFSVNKKYYKFSVV